MARFMSQAAVSSHACGVLQPIGISREADSSHIVHSHDLCLGLSGCARLATKDLRFSNMIASDSLSFFEWVLVTREPLLDAGGSINLGLNVRL